MSLDESDSYREFELYLEQVNDEIMRVFEDCKLPYNLQQHDAQLVKNKYIDSEKTFQWDSTADSINCISKLSSETQSDDSNEEVVTSNTTCSCNDLNSNTWLDNGASHSTCTHFPSLPNVYVSKCVDPAGNIVQCGNDKHSKSMDDLPTSSWLYAENNFNDDHLPATTMLKKVNKQTCSQLDRRVAEIEAMEACKWLRAAGFPQYAQMYEEMQFPVDVGAAQRDHPFLEPAVLQSLFRRLHALNRCARVCQQPCARPDDSEDEQCALSNNWTYQSDLRRWSRTGEVEPSNGEQIENNATSLIYASPENKSRKNSLAIMHLGKYEVNSKSTEESSFLRRTATTRFRHHREGVVVSDVSSVSSVSDILLKRLGSIRYTEETIHPDFDLSNTVVGEGPEDEDETFEESNLDSNNVSNNDCVFWNSVQSIESVTDGKSQVQQDGRPLFSLSCGQLQVLRKLALLKLTAHIEKYCPSHRTGWNWELPKFIKKIRTPMYKDSHSQLLSIPLTAVLQRTGQPLPRGIQESLEWLHQNGCDQVGLFRKPGVRSRIQALKVMVEVKGENINFNEQQAYDVADMIKQYFRELPEAVLTNKLSETFILIFQYVPPYLRKEAVRCTLLLMPDEHREVLQTILYYLLKIAKCADVNQMNENNLAICFAPSLFQYNSHSSFCKQSSPNQRELIDVKAAQECLLFLMKNNGNIFDVPREFLNQCKSHGMNDSIAVQLSDLGTSLEGGWVSYMQECQSALLREVKEKNRGWIVVSSAYPKIELSYKKVEDGYPLRLWKVCADIEAPPTEVVHRILRERHIWDDDLHSAKIIAQMNKNSEVFHYVRRNVPPLPHIDYCVIRTWNTVLPRGTCAVVETSVEHPDIPNIPNTVRGIVLASRYLIEPGGSGRSRYLHLSRVDTRGRMPEWNHKNFGHLNVIHAAHIQSSFRQSTSGPESKV
ncbi:rho GTPase-activating protein 7 isoform X1 [Photinus pyralis]|uniref:rho GTPase-activating protein 7 isoform X1 n=1 Tax=Photinus pyralis TaxID=7054 RepID=UPI0012677628|nr:rho GTPase-activating protein 7 isoform X1 [Photinus pyralis]XP_031335831.1 rho GTPase-activating protein 7 isoform X1 [Photinus pyralis]XP_031335832.1 rho GTPase-activating protein 7 isoform X1 [Photinus pyralis]